METEKHCLTCGRTHADYSTRAIPADAIDRYRNGTVRIPVPPVPTGRWDEHDWCRWIAAHGEWS